MLEAFEKLQVSDLREDLDVSKLNPHPGFATSIFVSWDEIADYFDLFEEYGLHRQDDEPSPDLINIAFVEARKWAKQRNLKVEDESLVKIEEKILDSLKDHWSSASALSGQLDFAGCVEQANEWSQAGAKDPRIFGKVPDPGKSVDYFLTSLGINFTIYPPFMIPYTEIYYRIYDMLPDWEYEDLNGMDIIETVFRLYEFNGNHIALDFAHLYGWDMEQVVL